MSPDESYYLHQYFTSIQPYLRNISPNAKIIDLGCGQGRFSIQMANKFQDGCVEGCDISVKAIEAARKYAANFKLNNVQFYEMSIKEFLASKQDRYCDIVLLTEVTFYYPGWIDDLSDVARILKSGGILILATRSQYFDALCLTKNMHFSQANLLISNQIGPIFGDETIYTWQTSEEIRKIIVETLRFRLLELRGIGVCSGIPGDPHDYCRPSLLQQNQLTDLMLLEMDLGLKIPDAGRYILTVSQKL